MKNVLATILFSLPLLLFAQVPTQTIRGKVIDKDTQQPLVGATIVLVDLHPTVGTTSDFDGTFILKDVPVGRHQITCEYLGYQPFSSDNIILNAAKELVLDIALIESGVEMEEVVVSGRTYSSQPNNELAVVSTRSFTVEETQRYAASVNDPGRMAMGFPGVQPTRDTRSDIIIRGNSGIGLLWRLEGIDIPNPNHFARRGSSGGGITIFSASLLANSDFSTAAFPADYGNAFSGVFDMRFRNGNKNQREYTARAGILGLDFSTEGPIKKGRSSYLLNYRYSTLGILNAMDIHLVGERISNTFQDFSFKLHSSSKNNKHLFSLWGIGGLSDEEQEAEEDQKDWIALSDYRTYNFETNMGVIGTQYTYLIDEKSYLKASLALMGQEVLYQEDTLNVDRISTTYNKEYYVNNRLSLNTYYNRKLSGSLAWKAGLIASRLGYRLRQQLLLTEVRQTLIDENGSSFILQPYSTLRWRTTPKLTINLGFHSLFFTLNDTHSLEGRLGMKYQLNEKSSIGLGYGLHSRILPIGSYFTRISNIEGQVEQPNLSLDLIKAHHIVLSFDQQLGKSWRLHIEGYFQRLFDVPVSADPNRTFSILNQVDGYATEALVNEGIGTNIGVDISIEKFFQEGTFLIVSGSIFNSTFEALNGETYDARYNARYLANLMGGKEWTLGDGKVLQAGLKILLNGGQRYSPPLTGERDPFNRVLPLIDQSQPFAKQLNPYFRPDIRIAFRKDNPTNAWTLSLDVQNAISRRNLDVLRQEYQPDTGNWDFIEQAGLTPILSYQVDF